MASFEEAEQSVVRYPVTVGNKKIYAYELKLSISADVINACMGFIQKDSAKFKEYILIFNAKHVKPQTVQLMALRKILANYKSLMFSKKLVRFAIIVKSFIIHRRVINLFDEVFDESKVSREKYNYFPLKDRDEMMKWLVTGQKSK